MCYLLGIRNYLLVIILLIIALSSIAEPYKSVVRFADGDVVSASVLNDLIDRIELSLKDVSRDEMLGTWTATQYWCGVSTNDPTIDATTFVANKSCNSTYLPQLTVGASSYGGGVAIKRIDTATISEVSGSDIFFDVAFSATSMFYNDATSDTYASLNTPKTHRCTVVAGGALFACALDSSIIDTNGGGTLSSYFNVQRLSSSRIKLFWGPVRGGGHFNVIFLDKKVYPPQVPTSVGLTVGSSSINIAWTPGDSVTTSYDIHRKTTATGSFASIGTATTESYSDTSVTSGATYWYRVFAKNANGTSSGSNVIKLTFNPSAALSSSSIGITDYINGIASSESEHKLFYSTESNTMTANLDVGKLDAENLNGLLAGSGGISPVLKFTLANVPSAGMSGTATLTSKVLDGDNATLAIGERAISTATDVDWSSDGEKLLLTVPNQTVEVILTGSGGTSIVGNWSVGGSSDLMTITSSGINKPVTLDVKLLEFLSSNIGATGPSITNFFTEGTYFYDIKIAGIGLMDSQGNTFNNVQGAFGVDSNPGTVAYIDDVAVSEEFDMATILVTLSTPSSQAVTLNYDTSGDSATSGQDYTASSGSLRIAAGNKVGAFTIPLTNDSYNESNEIFSVSLSNISNATLARTTAKVTIIDNDVT